MNIEILRNKKLFGFIIAIILALILAYIYKQNQSGNVILPGQKPDIIEQDQNLVKKVGSLILLPSNETPQIATVTDKTKLINQSFFANAENGDKVLIYLVNKKAILYRPSINKIVEVSPLGEPTPTPTPLLSPNPIATPTSTLMPLR